MPPAFVSIAKIIIAQMAKLFRQRFLFRIDEIHESTTAPTIVTKQGHWQPSTAAEDNVRRGGGISGDWWLCGSHQISPVPDVSTGLLEGAGFYRAVSMYYAEGYGFWVGHGDATSSSFGLWRGLTFEHDEKDYSSFLTTAGTSSTLRCQRPDQQWPRMLLPDIYHTYPMATNHTYGGLKGDLSMFLALIAFSMHSSDLSNYICGMYLEGRWQVHDLPHGRK
jgi:hypothetical protein